MGQWEEIKRLRCRLRLARVNDNPLIVYDRICSWADRRLATCRVPGIVTLTRRPGAETKLVQTYVCLSVCLSRLLHQVTHIFCLCSRLYEGRNGTEQRKRLRV